MTIPDEAVKAAAARLRQFELAAVAGIDEESIVPVAREILSAAAENMGVAAAEARGRKQAADQIAERFHEVVATYVHAVVHRGQWNWELDAKSKMEFVNGLTAVLTDDARACAAEQDTSGGGNER